jgi:hypothetical protein
MEQKVLRRTTMKKLSFILAIILLFTCYQCPFCYGTQQGGDGSSVSSINTVTSINDQVMQGQGWAYGQGGEGGNAYSEGGDSYSEGGESYSGAAAVTGDATSSSSSTSGSSYSALVFNPTSITNYKGRTSPVTTNQPYLPAWNHGGWGILQTYFPNGPSGNQAYERVFYPDNQEDMQELKGIINAIPYDGPLELIGGTVNGILACLGGPDNFHHGRGFEISNSVERKRRPEGKPLLVFIDSNISRDVLKESGYIYVGRVSLESRSERNWDQAYRAAIAETVPWDVDMIIMSGGMKGITVGATTSFPSAAGAYAQTNYSVSMFGGVSTGITEGKGEAQVSAECYRYQPWAIQKRAIPQAFYDKIHTKPVTKQTAAPESTATNSTAKTEASKQAPKQQAAPAPGDIEAEKIKQRAGITVSRELYEMSNFGSQQVDNVVIK